MVIRSKPMGQWIIRVDLVSTLMHEVLVHFEHCAVKVHGMLKFDMKCDHIFWDTGKDKVNGS